MSPSAGGCRVVDRRPRSLSRARYDLPTSDPERYAAFISYASPYAEWVEVLQRNLERAGRPARALPAVLDRAGQEGRLLLLLDGLDCCSSTASTRSRPSVAGGPRT